jgi:hypothetical protein
MDAAGDPASEDKNRRSGVCEDAAGVPAGRAAGGGAAVDGEARDFELFAAMGEIDGYGGEGGASGVHCAGKFGAGVESEQAAVRGMDAEGERMLGRMGIAPRGDGDNAVSLLLPNGSRIVGLPRVEDTIRGFSAVSMLVIDEASRVSDEMYEALRPMLAVGDGDLWMMSTPRGKSGFFYFDLTRTTDLRPVRS